MLPTLKYKRLRGDMIEVFKIVHNFYKLEAAVKLNFNIFSTTRGNKYKLHVQKSSCHYNIRKCSFSSRVVGLNMWNSLPNDMAESDTINTFKNRLDEYLILCIIKMFFLILTPT